MKKICLIISLSTSIVAFSQTKIVVPDSVLSYKVKSISLYLNEQPKEVFNNNERAFYGLATSFSSIRYNGMNLRGGYNSRSYDKLNPSRHPDPFSAVLLGTFDYLFNKAVYQK